MAGESSRVSVALAVGMVGCCWGIGGGVLSSRADDPSSVATSEKVERFD
mgnify:CR=1 FL=1